MVDRKGLSDLNKGELLAERLIRDIEKKKEKLLCCRVPEQGLKNTMLLNSKYGSEVCSMCGGS